jgi:hypothetical protein
MSELDQMIIARCVASDPRKMTNNLLLSLFEASTLAERSLTGIGTTNAALNPLIVMQICGQFYIFCFMKPMLCSVQ